MNSTAKYIFLIAATASSCEASEILTICGAPFPPYSYLEDGAPAGVDVEVAKAVFGQLGVQIAIEIEPFARCQKALKMGVADVALAVSDNPERQTYARFPKNHVWQISYVFFTNKATMDRYIIHGLEDARKHKLRIGIVRGASYHESFWKTFPGQDRSINEGYNAALVPAADTAANFRQLELDRIQLFPQDRIAGLWAARKAGQVAPYYYDTVLFSKDYLNAFSRASGFASKTYPNIDALMKAYDAKLAEFKKTDKYRNLFDRER